MGVKKSLLYFFVCFGFFHARAQNANTPLAFQDSVRVSLENTKNIEASSVGEAFASAWMSLGPDQQTIVQKQVRLMKKKGYRTQPHFVNYFGAIAAAVNIEKTDLTKLSDFLKVTGAAIQKDNPALVNYFLQLARDFFEHHALRYEKFFRLRVTDDDYSFQYLTPKAPDTTAVVYDAKADSILNAMPLWQRPVKQPEVTGAAIVFNKLNMSFATLFDSTTLKNTKGIFSLYSRLFVGEGGSFDWSMAGLGADSVFYEFNKYNFKTSDAILSAAQGKLTYQGKLPGKIAGTFEFRSVKHKSKKESVFPRFKSYENNVLVSGFGDDLKYTGGFGLEGAFMTSSSVSNKPALVEVMGASDKKFKASSSLFSFRDSAIFSNDVRIVIYQENDTIVHPSMAFRYSYGRQRLLLNKNKSALRRAPFTSSYFGIDFTADELDWDLKKNKIKLSMDGNGLVAPMVIESHDFYDPDDFRQLRNVGFDFNPLIVVVNYAQTNNTRDFSVYELTTKTRTSGAVKMAADFLSQKGVIDYDAHTGKIHVKEKAIHFLEAARGRKDYDNMKIHSLADTVANATIDLNKNSMVVHGVEEFKISDSLNVMVKPDSSSITFLHDRDVKFKGTINAGNFEITGKDFMLKYDSFFVNLNHIDSIRFYVTEKNGVRRRVNNSMVGADSTAAAAGGLQASANKTSGTLYINMPDNKSGRTKYSNFPRLDASAGGVIYFDRKEVLNGAYDRSVFFVVPPFKLDSLNDADPASINFEGTFVSSGMFPSFKERLHTMADKSLGFTHAVPASGYKMYHTNATFFGGLNMDNAGLRAAGKIEYLAASVESGDFVLYPDSVLAKGNIGEIKEMQIGNVNFPQVTFADYQLKWFPKQDKFKVKNLKDPFSLYQKTALLKGNLTVSKTGVTGSGRLSTRGSEVVSRDLSFSSKDFGARHARFEVKTGNPDKPALAGNDVRLKFDLAKNFATISPEREGVAAIEFPYAQFKTSIPQAKWDLSSQKIVMTKAPDVPLENSYFYTTRKELDSLRFNAEKAEYDIQQQQLKVSGIPYIVVADAKITPQNNEVLILENAKIGQLKNTVIVLDTLNGYHRLTDGVVDIVSRKEFSGYATYEYVNAANDTFAIKMTDFHLEPITDGVKKKRKGNATQQTVANGAVIDKDKILIAPRIYYKGDMVMYATRPALQLKGFVKLDLKKIKNYDTWIRYDQSGDEKQIFLDFDHSITESGRKVEAGLHYATDNSLYITFVSDKKDEGDDDFFLPSGSLYFDKESGEFKIENRKKAAGENLEGKVFNYNEEKQEVKFEGPVTFFKGTNDFNISASAIGSGNMETNEIKMNTLLLANMKMPDAAYRMMALSLQNVIKNEGAGEGLGDQTELLYKIANLVGEKTARDYEQKSQQSYTSLATVPRLLANIGFSNVNFKWSQGNKAFYSEGQIGVSHIGKDDINGAFEGFMEIRKNEDGSPVFHVFFKASPEAWYYFGLEDNRLMVQSSDQPFNDLIAKKTNSNKAKVGELVFIPGSNEETLAWVNKFRLQYYGLEAPYDLAGANSSAKKKDKKKEEKKEDDGF